MWLMACTTIASSQTPCGQVEADEALFQRYPAARAAAAAAELAASQGATLAAYARDEDDMYFTMKELRISMMHRCSMRLQY